MHTFVVLRLDYGTYKCTVAKIITQEVSVCRTGNVSPSIFLNNQI